MKKNLSRGFTLIELLVVIAIIGILASVVLASLNTARAKGADANIKANLANARAQAELYYDGQSPNTYAGVCTSGAANGILPLILAASVTAGTTLAADVASGTTGTCNDAPASGQPDGWAAEIPLKVSGAGFYCVDNSGASKINATAGLGGANDVTC